MFRLTAIFMVLLFGLPAYAQAQDLVRETPAETLAETDLASAPGPEEDFAGRPSAPPIQIGFDTIAGNPRYARRSEEESGPAVVHFSAERPRIGVGNATVPSSLPVPAGRVTGNFGSRTHPVSGKLSWHSGVDLAVPAGTPVRATGGGRVLTANWSGNYGLLVTIEHENGVQTRYAHLSSLAVGAGETVGEGDTIGLSGSTGRSTGPHVHYEVRVDGRAVDPLR